MTPLIKGRTLMTGGAVAGALAMAALGLGLPSAAASAAPAPGVLATGGGGGTLDGVPTHFAFTALSNGTGEFQCVVSGSVPAGSPMPAGMTVRGPVVAASVTSDGTITMTVDAMSNALGALGPTTVQVVPPSGGSYIGGTLDVGVLQARTFPPEVIQSGHIVVH
ncbi:MAG: hypothetical protein M0Z46_13060 [Actinomycetota bacterium]|nr:hypothetical protein [Actinomycetota bacterium]